MVHQKGKFIFRGLVFLTALVLTLALPEQLYFWIYKKWGPLQGYQWIWLFLMLEMARVFFPQWNSHVSCGRLFSKHFKPSNKTYTDQAFEAALLADQRGALRAALSWALLLFLLYGSLKRSWIDPSHLHLVVAFFLLCR